MRRPIRSGQSDLFSAPATVPRSLPAVMRVELVDLLAALLVEVLPRQQEQTTVREEACREHQDHA